MILVTTTTTTTCNDTITATFDRDEFSSLATTCKNVKGQLDGRRLGAFHLARKGARTVCTVLIARKAVPSTTHTSNMA